MEKLVITCFVSLLILNLISCKKDASTVTNTNFKILGKWSLVNDSAYLGVGINNHLVNYIGQSGDYFDFRTDNNVYIKEGAVLDTLSYNITSDSTILIVSFVGFPEASHIRNLSAHNVTINTPIIITQGGRFERTVNLRR